MLNFKRITAILLTAAFLGAGTGSVSAAEDFGFTVKAVPNEHTVDKSRPWQNFSIKGKAGTEITATYQLTNKGDKPTTIKMTAQNGFTQPLGVDITYSTGIKDGGITDKAYEFIPLVTEKTKEVVLGAKETKNVSVSFKAPELSGDLVGAFKFEELKSAEEAAEEGNKEAGFKVNISRNYIISTHLIGNKSNSDIPYVSKKAKAKVLGQKTHIFWNLENPNPTISKQKVSFKLLKGQEIIQEGTVEQFKMAPKTFTEANFTFAGELAVGDYVLDVNGTKMPFKISEELVEEAIAKAPEESKITMDGFSTFELILFGIILVIILVVLFFFLMKKREKKMKEKLRKEMEAEKEAQETN